VPRVFLSYRSSQRFWIESFRDTGLIEEELSAKGGDIFDYSIEPTTQGLYRDDIDGNVKESDVFVAVIDEKYQTSKDTLREFDIAYTQFFRNGRPVPQRAFGLIFVEQKGLDWFNTIKGDSRRPFPEDFAYLTMFAHEGTLYPYVGDRPNGPVIERLRAFFRQIHDHLEHGGTPAPQPPTGPVPIVLLGHLAAGAPPAIAGAWDDLVHRLPNSETLVLPHGWADDPPRDPEALLDLAARGALFLCPVDATFAAVAINIPDVLADLLSIRLASRAHETISPPFAADQLVYWMPSGVDNPQFHEKSQQQGAAATGPYFRVGSADDLARWVADRISPGHPAPPIRYEAAPLDRAISELASQLKTALDDVCRPPEPAWQSFIPNERPLIEELADVVKAQGGIFITHAIGAAAAGNEIPDDLQQKVLRYVDALEEFCAAKGLSLEQIYRVALVRQRREMKEFWKGPWSPGDGTANARLRGWHFLGIRRGETGGFEMDGRRVAQVVTDVKSLAE
jgi:hypothetical protein